MTPAKRPARRASWVLLGVAAALLLYYLLTPQGIFGSKAQGDGYFGFHYLPNLTVYRSVDMRHTLPQDVEHMDTGRFGDKVNRSPIGPALVMLPLFCVAESTKWVAQRALTATGHDPGQLGPPAFVAHTGQMFYTGLLTLAAGLWGMALLFKLLQRYVSPALAALGAAAALLATPQLWYLTQQPHYQHGLAFAASMWLLQRWDRSQGQLTVRRFALLGLLAGLAMLMRAQEVVFLLAPGLELLSTLYLAAKRRDLRTLRRGLLCTLALGVATFVAFLPQLWLWAHYFGWWVRPASIERMRPLEPALLEVLWSMRGGLLPWTPVAYAGLLGLLLAVLRRGPVPTSPPLATDAATGDSAPSSASLSVLCAAALLIFVADWYVVAASWVWSGGFSFGARRLSDCAGLWGIGVALLAARLTSRPWQRLARGLLLTFCAACVLLNALLCEQVRTRRLPDMGSAARPAFIWAQQAGAPPWLVRLLRHGSPLVQPMGLWLSLRHHAPATTWESLAGNYVREPEAHDFSITGDRWDFTTPDAARLMIEGRRPDEPPLSPEERALGMPVQSPVRILLQPFAHEPLRCALSGLLPSTSSEVDLTLTWNGQPLQAKLHHFGPQAQWLFTIPAALVHAHQISELKLSFAPSADLPPLRLKLLQLN